MSLVARFLLTIAAVFLAVNPVMACCVTGHDADVTSAQNLAPPCHDTAVEADKLQFTDNADDTYPGCAGCDSVALQAQPTTDSLALDVSTNLKALPPATGGYAEMRAPRLLRATGPPHSIINAGDTLISLKQLLLI